MATPAPKKLRGLALLSPEQRAAIASKGGIAAQKSGRGNSFTTETARAAGRKGGSRGRRKA